MATDFEKLIKEIRSLSTEDQRRLREALAAELPAEVARSASADEAADLKYQERLMKAGLLKAVKRRLRDQEAFERYKPIEVSGKPLSETIVEERR